MGKSSNDRESLYSFWRAWRFGTKEGYDLPKRVINELK